MLSNTFAPYRTAIYEYHLNGLDIMTSDMKTAKENIKKSITTLKEISKSRPNSFLMRVFFDAKTEEIVSIFSGGPSTSITDLVNNLNSLSPLNSSKWSNIKL
jgi:protoporphyrinogen oxidase